jgi:hypothetical protein
MVKSVVICGILSAFHESFVGRGQLRGIITAALIATAAPVVEQSIDGQWYTEGPNFGNWFRQTLEISGSQYSSHAVLTDPSGFTYELVRFGNAQYFGSNTLRLVATEWAPTMRDNQMLPAPPPQNYSITYFDNATLVLWDETCPPGASQQDCTFQFSRMR